MRGDSGLAIGETVTVEAFEPGDRIKVSGITIGKGYQGTIKRHGFTRPGLPRLAQRPQARLDRRLGVPVARLQGNEDVGSDGRTRVTQPGLVVHDVDPERNLLLVRGSVPGAKRASGDTERVMAAPKAP